MAEDLVRKKGLGRGLSALFGDDETAADTTPRASGSATSRVVQLAQLAPCPFQPRRNFDNASLNELSESLKTHGVLQPLLVRPHPSKQGHFEIVAGERRWRAAQKAKLHEMPVVVRELTDREVLEIGLIENLQRENLQPLEEAETYRRLIEEHDYLQEDLAQVIGKSRSHIANMMRLMTLPDGVKAHLMTGKMTAGHARALIGLTQAVPLAERIVREGLSVREAERLATDAANAEAVQNPKKPQTRVQLRTANVRALEDKIANLLGWRVFMRAKRDGSGQVVIPYKSLDQLDELLRRLGQ
jgi:ParB family chromosome partitioning protein